MSDKWICGKCAREVAQGVDDGQIPEHHRTCHKRVQTEPTDAQVERAARSIAEWNTSDVPHELYRAVARDALRAAFTDAQEEQS